MPYKHTKLCMGIVLTTETSPRLIGLKCLIFDLFIRPSHSRVKGGEG